MPNVEAELARHCQFPNMRGIREFNAAEHLDDPAFQRGYALLENSTSSTASTSSGSICVEAFGPERCIFATNWPVDRLFSTYDTLIDAYTEIIAGFSQDEQIAMFSGNAERLYRF